MLEPPQKSLTTWTGSSSERRTCTGDLAGRKNVPFLIRAFDRADLQAELLLVGRADDDSPEIAAELRRARRGDRIRLVGGASDRELVERNVDDPSQERHALAQLHGRHRVGGFGQPLPRWDTNHREAGDRAFAGQGHRLPGALVTGRTELLRRDGQLTALPAAHAGQYPGSGALEELLEVDHGLTHGRTGSRAPWRCYLPGCV